jgi:hypothetical protein
MGDSLLIRESITNNDEILNKNGEMIDKLFQKPVTCAQ